MDGTNCPGCFATHGRPGPDRHGRIVEALSQLNKLGDLCCGAANQKVSSVGDIGVLCVNV